MFFSSFYSILDLCDEHFEIGMSQGVNVGGEETRVYCCRVWSQFSVLWAFGFWLLKIWYNSDSLSLFSSISQLWSRLHLVPLLTLLWRGSTWCYEETLCHLWRYVLGMVLNLAVYIWVWLSRLNKCIQNLGVILDLGCQFETIGYIFS